MIFAKKVTNAIKQTESDLDEARTIEPDVGESPIVWDRAAWFGSRLGITGGGGSVTEEDVNWSELTDSLIPSDDATTIDTDGQNIGIDLGQEYRGVKAGLAALPLKRWRNIVGQNLRVNDIHHVYESSTDINKTINLWASFDTKEDGMTIGTGVKPLGRLGTESILLKTSTTRTPSSAPSAGGFLFIDGSQNLKYWKQGAMKAEDVIGADIDWTDFGNSIIPSERTLTIGNASKPFNKIASDQFIFKQQSSDPSSGSSSDATTTLYYKTGTGWLYRVAGDDASNTAPRTFVNVFDPNNAKDIIPDKNWDFDDSSTSTFGRTLGNSAHLWYTLYAHTLHGRVYTTSGTQYEEIVVHADLIPDGDGTRRLGRSSSSEFSEVWTGTLKVDDIKVLGLPTNDDGRGNHYHVELDADFVPSRKTRQSSSDDNAKYIRGSGTSGDFVGSENLGWHNAFWRGIFGTHLWFANCKDSDVPDPDITDSKNSNRAVLYYNDGWKYKARGQNNNNPIDFGVWTGGEISQSITPRAKTSSNSLLNLGASGTAGENGDKHFGTLYIHEIRNEETESSIDIHGNLIPTQGSSDSNTGTSSRNQRRQWDLGSRTDEWDNMYGFKLYVDALTYDTRYTSSTDQARGNPTRSSYSPTARSINDHIVVEANLVPSHGGSSSTEARLGDYALGWTDAYWKYIFGGQVWLKQIAGSTVGAPPTGVGAFYYDGDGLKYKKTTVSGGRYTTTTETIGGTSSWNGGTVGGDIDPDKDYNDPISSGSSTRGRDLGNYSKTWNNLYVRNILSNDEAGTLNIGYAAPNGTKHTNIQVKPPLTLERGLELDNVHTSQVPTPPTSGATIYAQNSEVYIHKQGQRNPMAIGAWSGGEVTNSVYPNSDNSLNFGREYSNSLTRRRIWKNIYGNTIHTGTIQAVDPDNTGTSSNIYIADSLIPNADGRNVGGTGSTEHFDFFGNYIWLSDLGSDPDNPSKTNESGTILYSKNGTIYKRNRTGSGVSMESGWNGLTSLIPKATTVSIDLGGDGDNQQFRSIYTRVIRSKIAYKSTTYRDNNFDYTIIARSPILPISSGMPLGSANLAWSVYAENLRVSGTVQSSLEPDIDYRVTGSISYGRDLGSTDKTWKNLYVGVIRFHDGTTLSSGSTSPPTPPTPTTSTPAVMPVRYNASSYTKANLDSWFGSTPGSVGITSTTSSNPRSIATTNVRLWIRTVRFWWEITPDSLVSGSTSNSSNPTTRRQITWTSSSIDNTSARTIVGSDPDNDDNYLMWVHEDNNEQLGDGEFGVIDTAQGDDLQEHILSAFETNIAWVIANSNPSSSSYNPSRRVGTLPKLIGGIPDRIDATHCDELFGGEGEGGDASNGTIGYFTNGVLYFKIGNRWFGINI